MSVQTQIDRISGEVTSQTDLIAQISTALDGKAAGSGGSVETCTVAISGYMLNAITTTVYTDGEISVYDYIDSSAIADELVTIENVICGSAIAVLSYFNNSYYERTISTNVELSSHVDCSQGCIHIFRAPTEANAAGTISFTYLD